MAYVEIISLESSLQNKCRPDRGRKTQPFKTVIHILECELDPHKAEDWGWYSRGDADVAGETYWLQAVHNFEVKKSILSLLDWLHLSDRRS